ncbi:MAG: site-specific integrase [Bacteroidetes bacterium]|nr:site-specific integrase [Bacteroidota bacterium]
MENLQYIQDNYSLEDISKLVSMLTDIKKEKTNVLTNSLTLYKFRLEYETYIKNTFSPKYLKSVKLSLKHLIDYFGEDGKITTIGVKDAEDFKLYIKDRAPKGYVVYLRTLKASFHIAEEWGFIEKNPFAKIKIQKIQKSKPLFLSKAELQVILNNTNELIFKEMFLFSFYTGTRVGEVENIKWQNIDLEKKVITIGDEEFTTKNAKCRIIPMSKTLYKLLSKKQPIDNDENRFVFCKSNGFPFRREYISKQFKKSCRAAGVSEKIHFHTLRHSFATNLSMKGIPLITIKELMGHSSIVVTEIYSHTNLEAMQNAIQTFDNIE